MVYSALLNVAEKVLVLWESGDLPYRGAGGWLKVPCRRAFGHSAFLQG